MSRYLNREHLKNAEWREPFRAPDQKAEHGDYALWWGPSRKKSDAEAFTEVSREDNDFTVSEYAFLGGYEAYVEGEREWTKQTVHFTLDDLEAWWGAHGRPQTRVMHRIGAKGPTRNTLQEAAALGVSLIGYYGGEEEDLTSEELP